MKEKTLVLTTYIEPVTLNWYYDGEQIYLESEELTPEQIEETLKVARDYHPSPPVCFFHESDGKIYPVHLQIKLGAGENHIIYKILNHGNQRCNYKTIYENIPEPDSETQARIDKIMAEREELESQGYILD